MHKAKLAEKFQESLLEVSTQTYITMSHRKKVLDDSSCIHYSLMFFEPILSQSCIYLIIECIAVLCMQYM